MTIVQPLGSPVTSSTIILFLWRDWGEETEERERMEREGERKGVRRSHYHTHSSMEWCELKLRKVQLDKPSEKKALGSSVAKKAMRGIAEAFFKLLHWFHFGCLPFPSVKAQTFMRWMWECKFCFLRVMDSTQKSVKWTSIDVKREKKNNYLVSVISVFGRFML